jgi:capsular exopolysaccharide synthesis family protein
MPHAAGSRDPASNPPPTRREPNPVAGRIEPAPGPLPPLPPEADLPPALSAAPDAGALLRALGRRWVAAVCLGGGLAVIAALTAWFLLSPKYTAFARIRVRVEQEQLLKGGFGPNDFRVYMRTQAGQIMGRNVISDALKREEVKRLNLDSLFESPAQYIEEELRVEQQEESEILTILLASFDPQVAVTLVKAIVDTYMDKVAYEEERARTRRVGQLDKVYNEAVESLKKHKDSLVKRAEQLGTNDPAILAQRLVEVTGALRDAQQQRNALGFELIRAQADLDTLDARLQALKDPTARPPALKPALSADPELKALRARIEHVEDFLDDLKGRGHDLSDPTPMAAARNLAKLKVQFERRAREIEEDLRATAASGSPGAGPSREQLQLDRVAKVNQIKALQKLYDGLQGDVDRLTAEKARLPQSNSEYEALRTEVQNEEKLVNDLGMQKERERIEQNAPPRISKLQEAELQKKDMKKQAMVTLVAPVAVLFAVCMALAWAEYRQRRVRTAAEVARGLGIRVVGAVPDVPHLEQHLVGADGGMELEGHPVLESIDALRTLVLHGCGGAAARVVLVTSATSGEGKTTLAAHLAGSLARAGRKTLLVDGDLRNPTAHQLFERPQQPGFSEALLGEVEVADAVRPTSLEGLSFLAAGQWDREVMQALARGDLEGVFVKLREEFDFLVVDSHPVLAAADSLLLGRQADAVILSVLREVSQMPRVYAAAQRLGGVGIRVLGAVVNGADPEEALPAPGRAAVA